MTNTTYLAITIGPIYKTLLKSHRTREIWMASYFFSVVMEKIRSVAYSKGNIILPSEATIKKAKTGAGIYPDRLIMTVDDAAIDVQATIIEPALQLVSGELGIGLGILKAYLQIHFLVISEADLRAFEYKNKDGGNITSFVFRLNYLLDNLELNATYQTSNEAFFKTFFSGKIRKQFVKKAFGVGKRDFLSVLEISAKDKLSKETRDYLYEDEEAIQTDNEAALKEIQNLSKVHKYMAILRGDGDNFGKVVGTLSNIGAQEVKNFSDTLTKYSENVADKITAYGGTVIYIGGDDVLCFAPVENGGKTIFHLIEDLNTLFHGTFTDNIYKENKVSMSYGLSICYWKYPLNEALDLSYHLLNDDAKKFAGKNCLAYQILLHSGQYRKVLLPFDQSYTDFMKMLNDFNEKDQLLQSLTHTFVEDKEMLKAIFQRPDYMERLNNYFDNHFNPDDPRKPKETKDFIIATQDLLSKTYEQKQKIHQDMEDLEKKNKFDVIAETLNQVNTLCRTLKFLIPKNNE